MSFGEWLKLKRKAAKLSQDKLAALAVLNNGYKYTAQYISNIERGYDKNKKGDPTRPDRDLVIALAKALNQDINEALTEADYSAEILSEEFEVLDGISLKFQNSNNWSEDDRQKVIEAVKIVVAGIKARKSENHH